LGSHLTLHESPAARPQSARAYLVLVFKPVTTPASHPLVNGRGKYSHTDFKKCYWKIGVFKKNITSGKETRTDVRSGQALPDHSGQGARGNQNFVNSTAKGGDCRFQFGLHPARRDAGGNQRKCFIDSKL
jgi:hypothetical protein